MSRAKGGQAKGGHEVDATVQSNRASCANK